MKIAVFTPFGSFSRETGIIYLLANYLNDIYPEVVQLRCNGVLSLCERDSDRGWRRAPHSCLLCGSDQAKLAAWAGVKSTCLSRYLLPRDIDETRRWVLGLDDQALTTARFREVPLFSLCSASFQSRFGVETPDLRNKNHNRVLRRLLLSTARTLLCVERFNKKFVPDVSLVPGGSDYLSAVFMHRAGAQGSCAIFKWDLHSRQTTILNSRTSEVYSCELLIDNVAGMRGDPGTWPPELIQMISQILSFLGLSDTQLALPIAR